MVVIPSWDKQSGVSSVACFMQTRPKPAYRWQGLDWIVGPEYSTHTEKPTWNHEKPTWTPIDLL